MAKFISVNAKNGGKKDLAALKAMDFEGLKAEFRKTSGEAIKEGKTIYELLREQLPVYPV